MISPQSMVIHKNRAYSLDMEHSNSLDDLAQEIDQNGF